MTPNEAIETIKVAIADVEWNYPLDYSIAFETAIEALEKQIPKKPNETEQMTDRERLIDLIIEAKRTDPETGSFTEYLAGYLISNGVTVSPCEIDFDERVIRNFLLLKIEEAEKALNDMGVDESQ